MGLLSCKWKALFNEICVTPDRGLIAPRLTADLGVGSCMALRETSLPQQRVAWNPSPQRMRTPSLCPGKLLLLYKCPLPVFLRHEFP